MTRHISRDQTIAGVCIFEVRHFFRWARSHWSLTKDDLVECLDVFPPEILDRLWETLLAEGYIASEPTDDEPERQRRLTLSDKAWKLARATGAPPIRRQTADRLPATTLDRADLMRRPDSLFAYRPSRILVYGSTRSTPWRWRSSSGSGSGRR